MDDAGAMSTSRCTIGVGNRSCIGVWEFCDTTHHCRNLAQPGWVGPFDWIDGVALVFAFGFWILLGISVVQCCRRPGENREYWDAPKAWARAGCWACFSVLVCWAVGFLDVLLGQPATEMWHVRGVGPFAVATAMLFVYLLALYW